MSKPARRLGRGLDSLVSNLAVHQTSMADSSPTAVADHHVRREPAAGPTIQATMAATETLKPNPFQPRTLLDDEAMRALADSIRQSGLLQPITVRKADDGYEIIAGQRRWAAAKTLGMTHVPVVIQGATNEQMLEFALIENIQREDLNAIDRAAAYRDFCVRFSLKPEEVARRLGEDRTTVVNYLRLLDLPSGIQALVAAQKLTMGHARCLLGVTDDARRMQLAESAVDNALSVRALEEIVRREKTRRASPSGESARREPPRPAHILDLQRRFEEAVKTKVVIHEGRRKATGRIIIEYYSLADFDRIAAILAVPDD